MRGHAATHSRRLSRLPGPRAGCGRARARLGGAGLGALCLLLGCAQEQAPLPENRPPHTYLEIQADTLNVTNYHTILHWWGTDTDGRVTGYAYRWSEPWRPAGGDTLWSRDPGWIFTTATLDTFDVPIRGAYAERTFEVRAIDDDALEDPVPARQRFRLENAPPLVTWTDPSRHPTLARPSLPAVSFAWSPEDYDGRGTIAYARLWLDLAPGEDSLASTIVVAGADTVAAFFPENFQSRYGERTAYLQIFDRADTGSDTLTWTWRVVPPAGEYLLIDTAWPATEASASNQDRFWRARMDALVPANYHVYDVETEGPFRSAQEVLPIFSLFKGVVWYGIKWYVDSDNPGGPDAAMLEALQLARGALLPYAALGRGLLVTGHNLIGTNGALDAAYLERTFGIEQVYTYYKDEAYLSDYPLPRFASLQCDPVFGTDSLVVGKRIPNTDFFRLAPGRSPLLWLEPGSSSELVTRFPAHAEEVFCVGAVADTAGGRIALVSTLLTDFASTPNPETAVESLLRNLLALP